MHDIFLSYAREDLDKAKLLATALEKQGWSVFWDRSRLLAGQEIDEVIEQAIEQSACMIVAWSVASKKSDWVRGEASIGRERKILLPILFDEITPPIAFRALHTENFSAWNGDTESDGFNKLILAVDALAAPVKKDKIKAEVPHTNDFTTAKPQNLGNSGIIKSAASDPAFIEPEMITIPAGRFLMGSNKDSSEQPIHEVCIDNSFSIAKYPVTFEEYALFIMTQDHKLPENEGWGQGKRPVINVSWDDAQDYAKWLSNKTGKPYRLLSEAEWEYAARAKTTTDYYWPEQENAEEYAWFDKNSKNKIHPIGQKKPNAFGLYDMTGNVWEWVQDFWYDNYDNAPANCSSRLENNKGLLYPRHVLRGGAWKTKAEDMRLTYRGRYFPEPPRSNFIGFRLARD